MGRRPGAENKGESMGRIVVAVAEGGEDEAHPLSEALALLGPAHDYLFLSVDQGVVPASVGVGGVDGETVVPDDEAWNEADASARAAGAVKLAALVKRMPVEGDVRVESGDPGERICAVAAEVGADLVVMGSRHTGAIRRLISGSVSNEVTQRAPCPVLLTRNKGG
jgi:nucleotide-binding universal stress UspA family protein